MAINQPLDPAFLATLPVQDGFRQRGHDMTRIEVLTDTAFAFAVTMLVISINELPRNWSELLDALKQLPALAASFMQIMLFWYGHVKWSRRFGLEDLPTIWLSAALVFVMLVFVYFLRLLFSSAFAWASGGFLPSEMAIASSAEVRALFIFYGTGFFLLSGLLALLNLHALRLRERLSLNAVEVHATRLELAANAVLAVTAAASILLATLLDGAWLALAGAVYASLGVSMPLLGVHGERRRLRITAAVASERSA